MGSLPRSGASSRMRSMDERAATRASLRYRDRGDAAALADVFDALTPGLQRVARQRARSAGEADDLVQTSFLCAIEGRERFDAGGTSEARLHGIP